MEVLEGIQEQDWAKMGQIVVEVHDKEGRLSRIKELLEEQGYQQEVEQEELLEETNQYTVYARRVREDEEDYEIAGKVWRGAARYWSGEQLATAVREHVLGEAAGVHGAGGVCVYRGDADDAEREGGSQGFACS